MKTSFSLSRLSLSRVSLSLLAPVLFAAGLFVWNGCTPEKGDPVGVANALNRGVVADLAAASLGGSSSTQGITAQMELAAGYAGGGGFPKAAGAADLRPFDTTIVRDKGTGLVTYHYVFTYSATITNLGNRLDVDYTMRGTLDTPRMSSADSAAGTIAVTHIVDPDTAYTVNATHVRTGTQQSKIGEQYQFTSTTDATFTDVKISKASNQVQSGSAAMIVSGHLSTGAGFSYLVAVTFLGNNQATLVVNGLSYSADLSTGTATPIEG